MSRRSFESSVSDEGPIRWQVLRGRGLPAGPGTLPPKRARANPTGVPGPSLAEGGATVADRLREEAAADQRRDRVITAVLDGGVFLALVTLVIFFSLASPYFLTGGNLANLGIAVAVDGIMAAGITVCLIAGQLDLSIGSVLGLSTVTIAGLWVPHGLSLLEVIVIVIASGVGVGLVNSFLVISLGINSIITTLAIGIAIEGVADVTSRGQLININDPRLTNFVNARPGGVPVPVIMMAGVYLAVYVFLNHTRAGWHVYATGANRTAAARSGIRVGTLYRGAFVLSGALAALAGIIYAGQGSTGEGDYGQSDTFLVITAVLLGGIGLSGGAGKIERTLVGVLLIGVLTNGLILLNVQSFYQELAEGIAFVAAVTLGALKEKRAAR